MNDDQPINKKDLTTNDQHQSDRFAKDSKQPAQASDQSDPESKSINEQTTVRLAVRSLAEMVYRRGGLGGPIYGGVSASEGQRLHKRFSEKLANQWPDDEILTEKTVRHKHTPSASWPNAKGVYANLVLDIGGRIDALILKPDLPFLIEVKSFSGSADLLPQGGETVHWAQAKLYGWLYLLENNQLAAMQVGLSYIHQETEEIVGWQQTFKRSVLKQFFEETCRSYMIFAADVITSQKRRLQSGLDCRFPYTELRPGQKVFMQEVIGAVRQKGTLLAQAPTGTGKTMAALYPAVKALSHQLVDHAFYLTAMTSTRQIAVNAIKDLRTQGLQMKAIVLYAKEKLCLEPDIYCDNRQCRYATSYYDHLPAALRQLFLHETIDQDALLACARKHRVCPFELALDMSLYCEFIICDYNYAFDPRVKLDRFFGQDQQPQLLLVDEAHNLPDRSRSMFSAVFEQSKVLKARLVLFQLAPQLEAALARIDQYLSVVYEEMLSNKPAWNTVEKNIQETSVMQAEDFRAIRQQPESFLSLLLRFTYQAHLFLDSQPDWSVKKPLLDVYFQALFFLKIAEGYFDEAYVTAARLELLPRAEQEQLNQLKTKSRPGLVQQPEHMIQRQNNIPQHEANMLQHQRGMLKQAKGPGQQQEDIDQQNYNAHAPGQIEQAHDQFEQASVQPVAAQPEKTLLQQAIPNQTTVLELMCLNASEKLAAAYRNKLGTVFFSATLSPMRYYSHLLHGYQPDLPPETLILPSPFPAENLHVMVCTELSVRWQQRTTTMPAIRDMILSAVTSRVGNYLVYLPSFAYLRQMRQLLRMQKPDAPIDYMFQLPNLSDAKRQQYLARFNQFGEKTLLAFAVMGGQFSEGIDLIGEKLTGVIIVGVGLPKLSPEREIMRQYYEEALGQGYAHAYLFPGFNKVQQAAGRVIRSETDRGFILLIDDRYQEQVYRELFPAEWQTRLVANPDEVQESLFDFWG